MSTTTSSSTKQVNSSTRRNQHDVCPVVIPSQALDCLRKNSSTLTMRSSEQESVFEDSTVAFDNDSVSSHSQEQEEETSTATTGSAKDGYLHLLVEQALANYNAKQEDSPKLKSCINKPSLVRASPLKSSDSMQATEPKPCQNKTPPPPPPTSNNKRKRKRSAPVVIVIDDDLDCKPDAVASTHGNPSTRPASPAQPQEPTGNDVVLPEDEAYTNPRYFALLIRETLPLYSRASSPARRTKVVQRMLSQVVKQGGRLWVPPTWNALDTVQYMERWLRLELECLARLAKQCQVNRQRACARAPMVKQETQKLTKSVKTKEDEAKSVAVTNTHKRSRHEAYSAPPPPGYYYYYPHPAPYTAATREAPTPAPTGPLPRPGGVSSGPYSELVKKTKDSKPKKCNTTTKRTVSPTPPPPAAVSAPPHYPSPPMYYSYPAWPAPWGPPTTPRPITPKSSSRT